MTSSHALTADSTDSLPAGEKPYGWILSPTIDMFFCCGGLVWILVLLVIGFEALGFGTQIENFATKFGVILPLMFNYPHIGATLVRLYNDPELVQKLRFQAVWAPILLVGLTMAAFANPEIPPVLLRIYLLMNAFHWCGQAFGVALIYCFKRGYNLAPIEKSLFWWSINSAAILYLVHILSDPTFGKASFSGVYLARWNILPPEIFSICCVAAGVILTLMAAVIVRKFIVEKQLIPVPALMVATLGFISFATWGHLNDVFWLWVGSLFHGSQYLVVSASYFLKEKMMPQGVSSTQIYHLLGNRIGSTYMGIVVMIGAFIFYTVPTVAGEFTGVGYYVSWAIFSATVSFHHFLVDAAVWRLRDRKTRDILLA
jgi:hypothetical protein